MKSKREEIEKHHQEVRTDKGNIIGLACGPLRKERYVNPTIEKELIDFKKEIEQKFAKSKIKNFRFPRVDQSNYAS